MATKVMMEALSPTMEEGRLVEWKKAEGDAVAEGDVLAEVETDKAVMELVARAGGVLLKQVVAAGETVPVASVVGWVGEAGEAVPVSKDAPTRGGTDAPTDGRTDAPTRGRTDAPTDGRTDAPTRGRTDAPVEGPGAAIKASPLARKLASERGLDLASIAGTGPDGRVVKRDVEAAGATAGTAVRASVRPSVSAPAEAFTDVPLSQIRKAIAKRLVQSLGPIPTFYLTTEVDMERAADAREALRAARGDEGKVSFNDIILKAVATALSRHPECNAWWQENGVRQWHEVHLGMAVAIPDGLITPVIRHADRKTLREISAEARELAGRARERKLQPDEYTGATFSVSNLGMYDIDEFTALINPPEAGIVAVGRMADTAVVVDGQVQVRKRMRLTMSCDHRVIDGATGAEFLRTVKLMLENPLALVW
jgi:pyruvate dehydrogenase E2 component (dihydrolipoamide acetyltransferase)